MKRSRFLSILFVLLVVFLFLKIYQHNRVVKMMYQKQRLEMAKDKLIKEKNNLLVTLYTTRSRQLIKGRAEAELGMEPLNPTQMVTVACDHKNQYTIRA